MKPCYGIAPGENGRLILAHVCRAEHGLTITARKLQPNAFSIYITLFHRGLICALPTVWRERSAPLLPHFNTSSHAVPPDEGSIPYSSAVEYSLLSRAVRFNGFRSVSEEAFLETLPRHMLEKCPKDFFSLYLSDNLLRIGVISEGKLIDVYPFRIGTPEPSAIESALGRVERHLRYHRQFDPPRVWIFLGSTPVVNDNQSEIHTIPLVPLFGREPDKPLLAAAGAALDDGNTPWFDGNVTYSRYRRLRPSFALVGILTLILPLVAAIMLFTLAHRQKTHLAELNATYERIMSENREIRHLQAENNTLAAKINEVNRAFSERYRWSRFFSFLSGSRPDRLYIERLGSEVPDNTQGTIRLSLSGQAGDKSDVNLFIENLQKQPWVTDIVLVGLSQDKKAARSVEYTITCTVALLQS